MKTNLGENLTDEEVDEMVREADVDDDVQMRMNSLLFQFTFCTSFQHSS